MSTPVEIAPARGKLGVLLVGLGAVSTTTIAGVLAIRKGFSKPIGSLTQMGTVRLGRRTEGRSPKISDVVSLSTLDDLVTDGYLRELPVDPFTNSKDTWQAINAEANVNDTTSQPGIYDVKSGSGDTSLEGTPYSDWD